MKHIKGMLVFIGLFVLVGCTPDQEPTKQTTVVRKRQSK